MRAQRDNAGVHDRRRSRRERIKQTRSIGSARQHRQICTGLRGHVIVRQRQRQIMFWDVGALDLNRHLGRARIGDTTYPGIRRTSLQYGEQRHGEVNALERDERMSTTAQSRRDEVSRGDVRTRIQCTIRNGARAADNRVGVSPSHRLLFHESVNDLGVHGCSLRSRQHLGWQNSKTQATTR